MKRLSSSGLDDLNLGASFEPGATIRFTVKEDDIVFSAATVEDGICVALATVENGKGVALVIVEDGRGVVDDTMVSLGWELDEGIPLVLSAALDNCLSTIEIFFCLF